MGGWTPCPISVRADVPCGHLGHSGSGPSAGLLVEKATASLGSYLGALLAN